MTNPDEWCLVPANPRRMICLMETNWLAEGTLLIADEDGCTIHAEHLDGMVRLNCTSPYDTHVAVDLSPEQVRELAAELLRFADHAATSRR